MNEINFKLKAGRLTISDIEEIDFGKPKPKPKLRPIFMDIHLDYHDQLINKVGKALSKTKKQLHDTELIINLEPALNDPEHPKWVQEVDKKLTEHLNPDFPTLSQLRKEYAMKKLGKGDSKARDQSISRGEWMRRANNILSKQTLNLQKKILSGRMKFGGSVKGEVLKVIPNYAGGNTIFQESRTLIRKDGQALPDPSETSLPPWIGPQYYSPTPLDHSKSDTFYKMPFRQRKHHGTHGIEQTKKCREAIRSRQREVLPSEENMDATATNNMLSSSSNGQVSIHDLHDFSGGDEEGAELSRWPSLRTSFSSTISGKSPRTEATGREDQGGLQFLPPSRKASTITQLTKNTGQLSSSDLKDAFQRSRRKVSVLCDPIKTHHAYTLKILEAEDKLFEQRKSKDYTLNALSFQPPLQLLSCDIEPLSTPNTAPDGTPNTERSAIGGNVESILAMQHQAIPKLKYSSEVFRIKKVPYRSAEYLLKENKSRRASKSPLRRGSVKPSGSQPVSRRQSTVSLGGSISTLYSSLSGSRPTSSRHGRPTTSGRPGSSHSEKSPLQSGQSTPSDGSDDENNDFLYGMDIREDRLAVVEEDSQGDNTTSVAMPFEVPPPTESVDSAISDWCKQRNVVRVGLSKAKRKDSFLEHHHALPSVEFSLAGLLLQENPYTEEDELIRMNMGRDVDSIKV
eukprot:gene9153-10104_t